jgi:TPR repeat protein
MKRATSMLRLSVVIAIAVAASACTSLPKPKLLTAEETALREKGGKHFAPAKAEYLKTDDVVLQTKALGTVLEAAKMNCPEAMYFFGHHYYRKAKPTREEVILAVQWIGNAATEDYPPAMSAMAIIYMRGYGVRGAPAKALKLFKRAAAFGDTFAMYNLGLIYFNGYGVIQDFDKSADWFRKAVEKGDVRSSTYLGKLYLFGRGVFQSVSKARKHFRFAASKGDGEAMMLLGSIHKTGTGVDVDMIKAREWFKKAVDVGYAPAKERLDEIQF